MADEEINGYEEAAKWHLENAMRDLKYAMGTLGTNNPDTNAMLNAARSASEAAVAAGMARIAELEE